MKKIIIPTVDEVESFVIFCRDAGIDDFDYPLIDGRWRDGVSKALKQAEIGVMYGTPFLTSAAKLFCLLIMGHYLVDGNKRTSLVVLYFYLDMNGFSLRVGRRAMKEFAVRIARRRNAYFDRAVQDVEKFIVSHGVFVAGSLE